MNTTLRFDSPATAQGDPDSEKLDALIAKLREANGSELLVEHLETAHAYLLGAMPQECALNLEFADKEMSVLSNKALQREAKDLVAALKDRLSATAAGQRTYLTGHPPPTEGRHEPAPTAIGLAEFFHGSDLRFGTFYPVQHVVTVFPSFQGALDGQKILQQAGLQAGDVLAVPGEEVARYLQDRQDHRGLWALVVAGVSRFLDTEAVLIDCYLKWGREGAGFLITYGRTEADMERIPALLKPLDPQAMHGFMISYIRHLL